MLCRDRGRGEKAKAQVQSAATNPDCVHLHICDLASLEDIRAFVERWSGGDGSPRKLDCLVNNAGLMAFTRMDTVDGVELNFGVNVLGTYVLTELLLPCLKAADSPRVVTVSSAGMLLAGREALRESTCTGDDLLTVRRPGGPVPDAQAERGIDGQQQYSRNKRCQVALTEHWAATHAGVRFWVMHPGWASTDGLAKAMPEFHSTFKSSLRTEEQGADTILWLSIAEEALKHKDATFFLDRQSQPKHLWFAGTGYGDEDVAGLVSLLNRLARGAGGCEAKQ
jgi:dehydrogenase/reductase SDR family member 12